MKFGGYSNFEGSPPSPLNFSSGPIKFHLSVSAVFPGKQRVIHFISLSRSLSPQRGAHKIHPLISVPYHFYVSSANDILNVLGRDSSIIHSKLSVGESSKKT